MVTKCVVVLKIFRTDAGKRWALFDRLLEGELGKLFKNEGQE